MMSVPINDSGLHIGLVLFHKNIGMCCKVRCRNLTFRLGIIIPRVRSLCAFMTGPNAAILSVLEQEVGEPFSICWGPVLKCALML
jgi:hypothetical protein